ncbi:F-box/WD-40 repeat-containing protein [Acorus calamus]|uniref:F-box/WD-40 repeat-containing protein n=1 Tax=Acorus calamus TaxID=4465 RepID=A0AAV9CYF8_ACOCL|nr:F-box/WD-40 repeat-containing protein [Acorus calamus]
MEAGIGEVGTSSRKTKNLSGPRSVSPIGSLDADILRAMFSLLNHFDLIRCSAVCKSWHIIINNSTLMKDLYEKNSSKFRGTLNVVNHSNVSLKWCLKDLAMAEHRLALTNGYTEVHQWHGHYLRVSQCRMKRGLILTGVGDKVLRLWSSGSNECLGEYSFPDSKPIIDFDFDESKVVGLLESRICMWRRTDKRSIFPFREISSPRGICMRYSDPDAVIGCDDGTARVFDMYTGSCSRIIRTHAGSPTCLAFTDCQMILCGSSLGRVTAIDLSTGEHVASLKSTISHTGIRSLCFNQHSYQIFAGSTAGYTHCWDLRTLRPLWETRISPNVLYGVQHLQSDTSTLAVGGIDGVLRIVDQNNGAVLSRYVMERGKSEATSHNPKALKVMKARALSSDVCIDRIPKQARPAITGLAVGMKKIVTTHNEKYIRMWKFND